MNLQSGENILTVKDIAVAISLDRSEEGLARTMRQIRHWTQNDLLRTISEKNTGKGVPRLYGSENTLGIALILQELTRYGTTVDILKPVAEELWDSDEGTWYLGSALGDYNAYLQVSWCSDPITGKYTGAEIEFFEELDFSEIRSVRNLPINSNPTSSILVNMTELFERLY